MSQPKITLQQALAKQRERPTTAELELAVVEFLDMTDSEQKAALFREMCYQGIQLDWIMGQLKK